MRSAISWTLVPDCALVTVMADSWMDGRTWAAARPVGPASATLRPVSARACVAGDHATRACRQRRDFLRSGNAQRPAIGIDIGQRAKSVGLPGALQCLIDLLAVRIGFPVLHLEDVGTRVMPED